MACFTPLTGYFAKEVNSSGRRGITFLRGASLSGVPLRLPCGQCVGCRLEKARVWAMRCLHEKQMHSESVFLTLTYDDEFLPWTYGPHLPHSSSAPTLVKRDFQLFMKRLRKAYGDGVRFYACGEYGPSSARPHYHALIFNWRPEDAKLFSRNARGEPIFTSEILSVLWPFGFSTFGDVTFDSACYVARYVIDKITGDLADAHYAMRQPEFSLMSRRPGIGYAWYMKYAHQTYALDSVLVNGVEVKPPRYYDDKFEMLDSMELDRLKEVRRQTALLRRADSTPARRRVREKVALAKLALKSKGL